MIEIKAREVFALLIVVFLLAGLAMPAVAQQQPSDTDLVKQTQNPWPT